MNNQGTPTGQVTADVCDRVLDILAQSLAQPPADGLQLDHQLIDIVEDSFEVVEIVFALEEEFDVDIPDQEVRSVRTIGDLVARLEKLTADRTSAKPDSEPASS